jgi:hypothetical protein
MMQGIALGRCRKSDGMIFYSPHSKELYVSSDYKLDEGRQPLTAFNLPYDGGIFVGLYTHNHSSTYEPFPEGTSVSYPTKLHPSSSTTTFMRGAVISVPIPQKNRGIPLSDQDASLYIIRLTDSSVYQVSPDVLETFVTPTKGNTHKIRFPSWLGNHQKVMYLHEGIYVKGVMEWCLDTNLWHFSQRCKNGSETFGVILSNFCQDFQKYIDDGTIVPGWHSGKTFNLAGSTCHVSTSTLTSTTLPASVLKALHRSNPDCSIWLDSYREEYYGLVANQTFDIISEDEYHRLCRLHGTCAIPSMCTFIVKHTNGIPTRADSRIVVLGNLVTWNNAPGQRLIVSHP